MSSLKLTKIVDLFNRHKKVVENYFFMTVLQVINSLFYVMIYPYLIRTLGAESYGLYIYALSIVTYFIFIVNFGFDLPATKAVALENDNPTAIANVLSCIFTAKIYLLFVSVLIFSILLITVPFLREHYLLFIILFVQTNNFALFLSYCCQGMHPI